MSKKYESTTEAELEAEFIERNNNLKRTWNNIIDKVDHAARSTHDYLEAPELRADIDATADHGGHLGAFKNSSSNYYNDNTTAATATNTTAADNLNTSMHDGTRRRSSIIGEQTSRSGGGTGWGVNLMDHKLMNSVYNDIHAMHSSSAEEFEGVASKIDETFGNSALS
ncbi:hypothetical protein HPULCUR_001595 [Helicostylum pulchrum]|uniref:Uncharacterized protein n=1 Tax=Helicostylum pulchrum TaxID=562976 RepID=A0ABP9XPD7_9FUNG